MKNPRSVVCRSGKRGFTVIELLVVAVILGVLIAIALGAYSSYVDKAKRTVAVSTLDTVRKLLEIYYNDRRTYPPDIDFTTGQDSGGATVFGPLLLDQINKDLTVPVYNSATDSYTFRARGKDSQQTLYTLTPERLTY